MTAKEGIEYLKNKCPDNEPIFILRGRDKLAYHTVLLWGDLAEKEGVNESKVCDSIKCAFELRKWNPRRLPD
jgi:hypothetical protein